MITVALGLACVVSSAAPCLEIESLRGHVAVLAADSMEGRGLGTRGIDRAAAYLREELASLGLRAQPAWCPPETIRAGERPVVNVIGSSGPDSAMIALCAHYDHLGMRADSAASIPCNGAHDNASGVAVVLEAARVLRDSLASGLLVCLFSGEEEGLLGSAGFLRRVPAGRIRVAVCVDAVGHLDSTLLLIGTEGQPTLSSLAVRAADAAGIPATVIPSLPSGDHASFLRHGIPALGISTGPHALMNTPGDDPETLRYPGMCAVTRMVVTMVRRLDDTPVRLEMPAPAAAHESTPRRVRLGTIPDLGYAGPGMRIAGVVPSSPAEQARLRGGDVLTAVGGQAIGGAADLAAALARFAPGDTVRIEYVRGVSSCDVEVILSQRE